MKTKNDIINAIIEYYKNNDDEFISVIEDLDNYSGYLGDDRMFSMDELDEMFCGKSIVDVLQMAFFGYDGETWHYDEDKYRKYDAPFNPNRKFFGFNGYGNFVSYDEKDYSDKLDKDFVEELCDHRGQLDISADVEKMLDELEEIDNEEV